MLGASLKDETTNMRDGNKHKVPSQMNQQTANPKINATVFSFFSSKDFF
jgi:hypothetical protein